MSPKILKYWKSEEKKYFSIILYDHKNITFNDNPTISYIPNFKE